MRLPRAVVRHPRPCAALWAALALPAIAGAEPSAVVPQSALHACAVIASASERLACYDQLSGRDAQSAAGQPAPAPAAASTPAAGASPAGTAAAAAAAAASATAPATPPKESFGLYAAEHPAPPLPQSLRARVISLGRRANGRMTVELEGGQLWELEDSDPLLAVGDMVNIRRAALGSFMMETPTGRNHRARRLD